MRRSHFQLCAAVLALTVGLVPASPALAAQDELSGGTVTLETKSSKSLKLKPRSLKLSIASGAVDPVSGDGTVDAAGTLRVKAGKRKAKVKIAGFSFGANGGPGKIDAKVGKKRVEGFGDLSGGTVVRDGLGAQISGVAASLGKRGAKALNRALKAGGKGRARAAGGGTIKAGQALGSVSATTIPKTVEVLPGGSMTLHTEPSLASKFLAHCVNALPGAGGVYPIAPATQDPVSAAFTFPVSGGAVAPSLAEGQVITGGGQGLAKNMGGTIPFPCDVDPPVGTTVLQTQLTTDFASSHLVGVAQLPTATAPQNASIAVIDFSTGTKSFDPATNQITITGATVTLDRLSAILLNQIFPNRSGDPSNDFSGSDVLGTLDLTATLR